ncbi:RluA family pseudouridine synthase [Parasegetibacter sp. NRK P23]|uniref:RluA family pseudouridine synthase n=1 Tax=Parasegetibacter sp. NRK P23 TaxID=2942999 RepID=UPI0020434CD6|nr:RluA family pseudouridine synthase [Parasegetibacter sp. NRK P23]MCM5527650.1 RluA family pseudouridine synthase [Parasegetibacter sp. NRK P23]
MNLQQLIIRENDQFIALNKPAGMLSIPDRMQTAVSLKDLLLKKYGQIFTVHRLDRDTSGVIVFAKNEASHKHLSAQFEERNTVKIYNGLVHGNPIHDEQLIDSPIAEHPAANGTMVVYKKGKPSQTLYKTLERFGAFSWMSFRIFTGRTHQIRVHMKHAGHPIVCDELYGNGQPFLLSSIKKKFKLSQNELEERPIVARLALHASRLEFTDMNGDVVVLEAEPPKDLRAALQQLRKWGK